LTDQTPTFVSPAIARPDPPLTQALRAKVDGLAKPPGALGRLEDLAIRVGAIQNRADPGVGRGCRPIRRR